MYMYILCVNISSMVKHSNDMYMEHLLMCVCTVYEGL